MEEEQIEAIIEQAINGALATIPMYLKEIEENNENLKVENPKEFVYGAIMGMALGIGSVATVSETGVPNEQKQLKVKDIIYKHMPAIRERIFS